MTRFLRLIVLSPDNWMKKIDCALDERNGCRSTSQIDNPMNPSMPHPNFFTMAFHVPAETAWCKAFLTRKRHWVISVVLQNAMRIFWIFVPFYGVSA
jgi:hypothetical protein